jgi:hypothetical protein
MRTAFVHGMKRTHLNALIDAAACLAFLALLSTGLILEYQLPPGSGGLRGFGFGRGASHRTVHLLWGWTRHEWGQVHYWIALGMMAVLGFHVLLHWKWILCTIRGTHTNASGCRLALGMIGLIFAVLLSIAPFLSGTMETTRGELRESRNQTEANQP